MSVKISGLPAAASALLTDEYEVNQGGTSKKVTSSQQKAIAPAIVQNGGVAFGVQQNNTTNRTLLVIINLAIAYDHLNPGNYQMDVMTNATTPGSMADYTLNYGAVNDINVTSMVCVLVAAGGWYKIINTNDPGGGNSINAVWECAL